ncbi:uncharacterized protein LOC110923919 [Helianthus annuus]|uniref:uncharacterized protein LOC110923919 n=1 Tax=Helianthus annuus TaxID=4232 RepID=UPI000B900F03|nr:uncharacterized protein LOC110923919 [Helianthus annuus]
MIIRGAFNFPPNPTPPVQPQPIPTQPVQQSEPDDDVEVVLETQPPKEKDKRKKGKQVVGEQPSKPKSTKWTLIEEEALAKAYIGTSTHLTKGNNQTGDGFWSKVLAKFLELMDQGPYRDIDSVLSKWRKINEFVNKFCDEYNKIYTSVRRSGMNDDDVLKQALEKYRANNAEFDEEEYAVHEAERPQGRDKSKKERAEGEEKEKVDLKMEEFMEHLKTYTDISAQKTKAKERAVEEKTRVAEEKLREKVRLSNEKI